MSLKRLATFLLSFLSGARAFFLPLLATLTLLHAFCWTTAQENPSQFVPSVSADYETFVRPYRETPLRESYLSRGEPHLAVLRITTIEGDDLPLDPKRVAVDRRDYRIVQHVISVSFDGHLSFSRMGSFGVQGSGYPLLGPAEFNDLKSLLAHLPDDHAKIPPPGRRVVIQTSLPQTIMPTTVRVYDRANLPDEILDIVRLARASNIVPWTLLFEPRKSAPYGEFVNAAISLPTEPAPIADSPLTILQGDRSVLIINPQTHVIPYEYPGISSHSFSPDGRYLLLRRSEPPLGIQIIDTKTWRNVKTLPGFPTDVASYFPSRDWSRAVFVSAKGEAALWNANASFEIGKLTADSQVIGASFSPDGSLVAVATYERHDSVFHVRVWHTSDATLATELRPAAYIARLFNMGSRDMLAWMPDGTHLLTVVAHQYSQHSVGVWDTRSGRYRGELTGCPQIDWFSVTETGDVLAQCNMGNVLLWDGAAALKRITEFEQSLTTTNGR